MWMFGTCNMNTISIIVFSFNNCNIGFGRMMRFIHFSISLSSPSDLLAHLVPQEAMDILEEEDMEVEVMEEVAAAKQSTNKNATHQVSNNAQPSLINNVQP